MKPSKKERDQKMKNTNTDKVLNANASDKVQPTTVEDAYVVELVAVDNDEPMLRLYHRSIDGAKGSAMGLLKLMIQFMQKDSIILCARNDVKAIDFTLMDNKSHELMRISTVMMSVVGPIQEGLSQDSSGFDKWWHSIPCLPEGFEDIDIEEAVSICVNEGWCIASTENGLVLGEGVTEREFPRRA